MDKYDHGFSSIGIVGLGLIGGSYAKAFTDKGISVYGYDKNEEILFSAVTNGCCIGVSSEFDKFINFPMDLLYICLPVDDTIDMLNTLISINYKGYVTDSTSTKSTVINKVLGSELRFCGAHPIAGKESSGFYNSDKDLFYNTKHILTPVKEDDFTKRLKLLHKLIGAEVFIMDYKEHDNIFANISHLPHLLSFILVDFVLDYNDKAFKYAGGGFRDFTRIAASDPYMWQNIFIDNKDCLIKSLDIFEEKIKKWRQIIENKNKNDLYNQIYKVSLERRKLQKYFIDKGDIR